MQAQAAQTILSTIRRKLPYLNPALRRIGDYTLQFPQAVKSMTIGELAAVCQVSESTITRFVKEIEVRTFPEMKIQVAEAILRTPVKETTEDLTAVYEDIGSGDDIATIVRKIEYRLQTTLADTFQQVNLDEVERAVDSIRRSDFLAFFAVGSSTLAVESGLLRFLRVGKKCQFFPEQSVQQMSAFTLDNRSVAIGISNSGRTRSVVRAMEWAKRSGATTIGVTAFSGSPLTAFCDIKIVTPTTTVPFGRAEYHESMTSKFAQIAVMDLIYSRFAVMSYDRSIEKLQETNKYVEESRMD